MSYPNIVVEIPSQTLFTHSFPRLINGEIIWEDKRFYNPNRDFLEQAESYLYYLMKLENKLREVFYMTDNHAGYYNMYRRFYHHRQKFCYRIDTLYSMLYAREELSAVL